MPELGINISFVGVMITGFAVCFAAGFLGSTIRVMLAYDLDGKDPTL